MISVHEDSVSSLRLRHSSSRPLDEVTSTTLRALNSVSMQNLLMKRLWLWRQGPVQMKIVVTAISTVIPSRLVVLLWMNTLLKVWTLLARGCSVRTVARISVSIDRKRARLCCRRGMKRLTTRTESAVLSRNSLGVSVSRLVTLMPMPTLESFGVDAAG